MKIKDKIPSGKQALICLKKPDRVVLHYGDKTLEVASHDIFEGQVVAINIDYILKFLPFMKERN